MNYSSERNDVHFVRCLRCHKILKCSRYDSSALLEHIRTDHPDIEIVEGVLPNTNDSNSNDSSTPKLSIRTDKVTANDFITEQSGRDPSGNINNMDSQEGDDSKEQTCENDTNADSNRLTVRRRCLYRISIGKWRPTNGTLYCPRCDANKRPLVRTRTERTSNNACSAAFLLSCWPFCFLLIDDGKEYLHCANCKAFLGLYDRKTHCIRPNREFAEYPK